MANTIWNPGINGTNPTVELIVTQSSQSIGGNYSVLSYSLILHRPMNITSSASKSYSVNVNGVTVASGTTTIGGSGDKAIASGTAIVYHNTDGTKTGVTFSFYMDIGITWSGYGTGNASGSGSINLTTIPRASSISSIEGGTIGSLVTVNISRASTDFYHVVIYRRTDGTDIQVAGGALTGVSFTPSLTDANLLPNATSGTATIIVHTYNGGTHIGTATKTFTVYVPASMVPSVSISASGGDLYNGEYVQGYSRVGSTINFTGSYGSWITSRSTVVKSGANIISSSSAESFISGVLTYSGPITIETYVTDSRGRSASHSVTVQVRAYTPPQIIRAVSYRCNYDGTPNPSGSYLWNEAEILVSPINNVNTRLLQVRYRARGGSWATIYTRMDSYTATYGGVVAADPDYSYEVEFYAGDHYQSATKINNVSTAFVLMDFYADGKSMAIGKVAENKAVLDINGLVLINNIPGYIIEFGSNLGGYYCRFGDGTQICWGKVFCNTDIAQTFTFARSFMDSGSMSVIVTPNGIASGTHAGMYQGEAQIIDRYSISVKSMVNAATGSFGASPVWLSFIILGRWQ